MQIVLPEKAAAKPVHFKAFPHPRTGRVAKFLVCEDAFYELTRVGSNARSALVHNRLQRDGSVFVATPIHAKFLLLRPLFENRDRALPLDILLELGAADDADAFPAALAETHAAALCSNDAGLYQLDLARLRVFLDACVARIAPALPAALRDGVLRCIQPVDPREAPSPELVAQAHTYAAVAFVANSWLPAACAAWFLAEHDFSRLEAAAAELHALHAEAQAHQFAQLAYKAPAAAATQSAPAPKPAKRRQAPQATNNKSLLDMFGPRAKKVRSGP